MPKCRNPECGKDLPKGMAYCGEDCLRQHLELRKEKGIDSAEEESNSQETQWLGQERRKRAMDVILLSAYKFGSMGYDQFASKMSYETGLSLRKITDDYLRVLTNMGFLSRNGNDLKITSRGIGEAKRKNLISDEG